METATIVPVMTAEELLGLPHGNVRRELLKGELIEMSPTGSRHGRVAARIARLLGNYVAENHLGEVFAAETGFQISRNPDTVRAPDVAFVSRERMKGIGDHEGFFPGAPDLAIEVVSPSDTFSATEAKALAWLEAGCRIVVVTDPDRITATVYRGPDDVRILAREQVIDADPVVRGWRIPVDELFG